MDNNIYTTYNNYALRFVDGTVKKVETKGNRGQWGLTQDNTGKVIYADAGAVETVPDTVTEEDESVAEATDSSDEVETPETAEAPASANQERLSCRQFRNHEVGHK